VYCGVIFKSVDGDGFLLPLDGWLQAGQLNLPSQVFD
jgi:hypothetical protein